MTETPNIRDEKLEILEGVLEKLVFASDSNDFIVGRIAVRGKREPITVVGTLPSPRLGETLRLQGKWQVDKKFGEQFRFQAVTTKAPSGVRGIEKYLSSGLVNGIGPEMARRIVAKFSEKTLDVIEKHPEKLKTVPGIGPVRAGKISAAFREQKAVREVMLFLQSHGISPIFAARIYKKYGQNSIHVVSSNPYCLANDIKGIGFKSADRIAGDIGFDLKSPLRAQAGILFVLESNQTEGHVYTPMEELLQQSKELLGMDIPTLQHALEYLKKTRQITVEDDRVYTWSMAYVENSVAQKVNDLLQSPRLLPAIKMDAAVRWIQQHNGISLSDAQIRAMESVLDHKVLIITGGPGTGKTTLLKSLIDILEKKRIQVLLTAPTGRAAKRLSEATNRPAKTIHRLLEYSPGTGFQRNTSRNIDADIVIVDEASMVDISLMHHLVSAIGDHAGLVLVGDADQLPSVGPGNVLADLIKSGKMAVIHLDVIFRQASTSLIISNAHLINHGEMPIAHGNSHELSDFYFIEKDDPEECVRLILEMVTKRIPERFKFDPMSEIQILSPMHKGPLGTENLNRKLGETLNPNGMMIKGERFRVGDRVMQVRNNYDKDVYNGDVGRIVAYSPENQEVTIVVDDREVVYHTSELDELTAAYAVSIHKSQGSEYKAVIVTLTTQHYVLLRRNLVYTAITRGKELVIIVGNRKALEMAVSNRVISPRYSHLAHKL